MANILGIASGIASIGSGIYNMVRGKKAPEEQYERQRKLNEQAHQQQLDMWNKTNYEAQKKHLENAGLNAGLMYGMSGGGGATTGNVGAGQAQQENVYDLTGAINNAKAIQAQIEVAKSQADKNRAEAEKIRGIDTEKATAETELTNIKSKFEQIQTEIAGETQQDAIRKIQEESFKMMAEAGIAQRNGAILEETANDQILKIKEEAIGTILENELKRTNKTLAEGRIKEIAENIMQRWESISVQKENIKATIENMEKLTEAMLWGAGINAAGNLAGDIVKIATKTKPLTGETTQRTIKRVGNETHEYKQTERY